MSKNLVVWIEATIMAALATALAFVPLQIGSSFTITVGQPVMVLYALRRGVGPGFIASFLWGVLHILVGRADILTPLQGFIEYFVAFAFTGVAGYWAYSLLKKMTKAHHGQAVITIAIASFAGTFARFFWHTIAGYYFWGQYAPEGWNPLLFSIVLNGASAIATTAFTILVLAFAYRANPSLFQPRVSKRM